MPGPAAPGNAARPLRYRAARRRACAGGGVCVVPLQQASRKGETAPVRDLPDLSQPAPLVAPQLIGCELVAHGVRARIVETEAYQSEADKACHAARGRTARTDVLYRRPGTVYLYLVYGLHVMLNLVCDHEDAPAAVLIRAIEILDGEAVVRRRRRQPSGSARRLANGPGKVCEALALDLSANGTVLGRRSCPLRLLPPTRRPDALAVGPRVGVDYAGPGWADRPWRWWEAGFPVAGERDAYRPGLRVTPPGSPPPPRSAAACRPRSRR